MNTDATGPRVAWEHLKLAALALWHPAKNRLPQSLPMMSGATRVYLVTVTMLYGVAAIAFLVPGLRPFALHNIGLAMVDGRVPHLVWGGTALVICFSQVGCLLTDRWAVWEFCAIGTAFWATAWLVVVALLAVFAGSYLGLVEWLVIVVMHYLFISNRFVPLPDTLISPEEVKQAEAEHELMAQIKRAVENGDET